LNKWWRLFKKSQKFEMQGRQNWIPAKAGIQFNNEAYFLYVE
jgi:hypothetical protein